MQDKKPLEGVRVFFVEDEALVAMLIEDYLRELGCVVAASARRVPSALKKLDETTFDVALLDINVAGENVGPVAEELARRNIPFVFASGYGGHALNERFADRPILTKPFTEAALAAALAKVLAKPGLS